MNHNITFSFSGQILTNKRGKISPYLFNNLVSKIKIICKKFNFFIDKSAFIF
jgi:hypothetical protein